MTTWFTSDTHFGHKNVIKYCNRPFETVDEMNLGLITKWNQCVQPGDEVYHLGDFAFCRGSELNAIVSSLNGQIYLIRGNHDHSDTTKLKRFAWVKDYYELKVNGQKIVLCHYPIESWNGRHHGAWHLHGHCHGSLKDTLNHKRLDVGVDTASSLHNFEVVRYYRPYSYDEICQAMSFRTNVIIDHHKDGEYE